MNTYAKPGGRGAPTLGYGPGTSLTLLVNVDVLSFGSQREMGVTADQFRRLALSFPEAYEDSHMDHPDFRVRGGKIFATLSHGEKWGMVKLTPEQQEEFVGAEPEVFEPVKGGWGHGGATSVRLQPATKAILWPAIAAAWCNAAPKRLGREFEAGLK
jgi:hypothetical protein